MFDFLGNLFSDPGQTISDLFSGGSDVASAATDGFGDVPDPSSFNAIAGDSFGNSQVDFSGADSATGTTGGLGGRLLSAGKGLFQGTSTAGAGARQLSREFRLQGQNRAMGYDKPADAQSKVGNPKSEDARAAQTYWYNLMNTMAYKK